MDKQKATQLIKKLSERYEISAGEVLRIMKKDDTNVSIEEEPRREPRGEPREKVLREERPAPARRPVQRDPEMPPRDQGKVRRGVSDVGITSGSMFGRAPILGGHKKGIFDDNRPIVSGGALMTGRPIFGRNSQPIVGNNGTAVSQGRPITRSPIMGDGSDISARIFGRRR